MTRIDFRSLLWQGIPLFLWASNYTATHSALESYTPGHVAFLRYLVASVVLVGYARAVRMRLPRRQDIPGLFLAGFLGIAFNTIMFNTGQVTISPGAASLLVNSCPIFTALLAAVLLKDRLGLKGWIGILVSFGGVALIAVGEGKGFSLNPGAYFILAGSMSYGGYVILQKRFLVEYRGLELGAYTMWAGTLLMVVLAPGLLEAIQHSTLEATFAVVYMGVLPSALANVMWGYVLAKTQASNATSRFYLIPPVAILQAWIWLGDVPTILSLLGGLVVLAGVLLVDSRSRSKPLPDPARPEARPRLLV